MNLLCSVLAGKRLYTKHHNLFNQITIGSELMFHNFETRFNSYLPIGKKEYKIHDEAEHRTGQDFMSGIGYYRYTRNISYEKSFWGFDFEVGGNFPQYNFLKLYSTYYFFSAKGKKPY